MTQAFRAAKVVILSKELKLIIMAHAINSKTARTFTSEKSKVQDSSTSTLGLDLKKIEFNRFGLSAIILLSIVCFSGVAIGLGGMVSPFEVGIIVAPTMAVLVSVIAVQPMKYVIGFSLISALVNLVICVVNVAV